MATAGGLKNLFLPRSAGHYQGGLNVAKIAEHAQKQCIEELTIYAFSTENWKRPQEEVDYLMSKPIEVVTQNKTKIYESNIRIRFKGRKDRLSKEILDLMQELEAGTHNFTGMILNVCIDYGSYDEIISAVKQLDVMDELNLTQKLMITRPCRFIDTYRWRTKDYLISCCGNFLMLNSILQNDIGQPLNRNILTKH